MPRELITIQVGQCGNQIGSRFWDMALREHAAYNKGAVFDEALSSHFRNVDARSEPPSEIPVGDGTSPIRTLKARAVLVDMEEGVVSEMLKGPLRDVFDTRQLLTDTSGAGNNWAHGFHEYGPRYRDQLTETIRRAAEHCESLQSFMLLHSLGGGTGSGVGSYILGMLADEFPEAYRFTASIFPSEDDDVITSPYNALLSAAQLAEHADCVLPVENQALMDICERVEKGAGKSPSKAGTQVTGHGAVEGAAGAGSKGGGKPFDKMNGIAANLLLHLTSSVRFEGSLNTDLNDVTMNLVPFPRMHFLMGSLAPLQVGRMAATPKAVDHMFTSVFSREHQVVKADPRLSTYLACGLLCRGDVTLGDISRNIGTLALNPTTRLKPQMRMVSWNTEGFKVGICSKPPVGVPYSVLGLSNSCCMRQTFGSMRERFGKLYSRKVYLHHYEQYMDGEGFKEADGTIESLCTEYEELEGAAPAEYQPRLQPVGMGFS